MLDLTALIILTDYEIKVLVRHLKRPDCTYGSVRWKDMAIAGIGKYAVQDTIKPAEETVLDAEKLKF